VLEVGKILVDMGPGREPIDIVPYLADPDDDVESAARHRLEPPLVFCDKMPSSLGGTEESHGCCEARRSKSGQRQSEFMKQSNDENLLSYSHVRIRGPIVLQRIQRKSSHRL
jgi:hypothetical protein